MFSNKKRVLFVIPILLILFILVVSYVFVKPDKIIESFIDKVNNTNELGISSTISISNNEEIEQDFIYDMLSEYVIKLESYYNKDKKENFIQLTMGEKNTDRVLMNVKAFYEDQYIYLKSNKLSNTYKLNVEEFGELSNTMDLLYNFSNYDIIDSGYEEVDIKRKYKEFKVWARTITLTNDTDLGSNTVKIYYVPFIGIYKLDHLLTIDTITFHIESHLEENINIDISQIDKEKALDFSSVEDILGSLF